MTNNENRDFVLIFLGIGLVSNPIMVNYSEFTKVIIKFHILLAAHIPGWRARCHMWLGARATCCGNDKGSRPGQGTV